MREGSDAVYIVCSSTQEEGHHPCFIYIGYLWIVENCKEQTNEQSLLCQVVCGHVQIWYNRTLVCMAIVGPPFLQKGRY